MGCGSSKPKADTEAAAIDVTDSNGPAIKLKDQEESASASMSTVETVAAASTQDGCSTDEPGEWVSRAMEKKHSAESVGACNMAARPLPIEQNSRVCIAGRYISVAPCTDTREKKRARAYLTCCRRSGCSARSMPCCYRRYSNARAKCDMMSSLSCPPPYISCARLVLPPLPPGAAELNAAPELNGLRGTVERVLSGNDTGRVILALDGSDQKLNIKIQNLRLRSTARDDPFEFPMRECYHQCKSPHACR